MVDRRGREVSIVRGETERVLNHSHEWVARFVDVGVDHAGFDALGPAGGARGVQHLGAPWLAVRDLRCPVQQVRVVLEASHLSTEGEVALDIRGELGDLLGEGANPGRREQHPRSAVVDDVGRLLGGEVPVDSGDVETGSQCRPVDLERGGGVVRQKGDDVAAAQSELAKCVGDRG